MRWSSALRHLTRYVYYVKLPGRQSRSHSLEFVMEASVRKNIPPGMFCVIGHDRFDHSDYLVKHCATQEEAFELADNNNRKIKREIEDAFYVYNSIGQYLRGEVDVVRGGDECL